VSVLAACEAVSTHGPEATATAGLDAEVCIPFPGEQVSAISWSSDGHTLAIASDVIGDGTTVIRRATWPDLALAEVVRDATIRSRSVAVSESGSVSWIREQGGTAVVEEEGQAGPVARELARFDHPAIFGLRRTNDGVVVVEGANPAQPTVLLVTDTGRRLPLFSTGDLIDSFGISADRSVAVVHHYIQQGDPGSISTVVDGTVRQSPAEGSGVARITVTGDGESVMYVDVSRGELFVADLALRERHALGLIATAGERSISGVLAWIPAPTDTLDVPVCLRADRRGGMQSPFR
jgi:hypothetical protein